MIAARDQARFEKRVAEQITASTPLLDGLESIGVELGEDHTAMWLIWKNWEKDR